MSSRRPYLIPFLDVTDNAALLPMLAGVANDKARSRALELLTDLDVQHRARAQPSSLSGGYVLTGAGLWVHRAWSPWTVSVLAIATGFVAGAFALHVMGGGAYEMRTVGALVLRLGFRVVVATVAVRSFRRTR